MYLRCSRARGDAALAGGRAYLASAGWRSEGAVRASCGCAATSASDRTAGWRFCACAVRCFGPGRTHEPHLWRHATLPPVALFTWHITARCSTAPAHAGARSASSSPDAPMRRQLTPCTCPPAVALRSAALAGWRRCEVGGVMPRSCQLPRDQRSAQITHGLAHVSSACWRTYALIVAFDAPIALSLQ